MLWLIIAYPIQNSKCQWEVDHTGDAESTIGVIFHNSFCSQGRDHGHYHYDPTLIDIIQVAMDIKPSSTSCHWYHWCQTICHHRFVMDIAQRVMAIKECLIGIKELVMDIKECVSLSRNELHSYNWNNRGCLWKAVGQLARQRQKLRRIEDFTVQHQRLADLVSFVVKNSTGSIAQPQWAWNNGEMSMKKPVGFRGKSFGSP